MKKLKLSLENLQGGEILSREQLKKVMGGDGEGSGGGGGCSTPLRLECKTPNGTESWCRNDCGTDPNATCRGIYPAYSSSSVTGECYLVIKGTIIAGSGV